MSLEKIRFKIKASGRHGTHSPFVYHFVEQVLRNKTHYPIYPKGLSKKEWNLLNATIHYLAPTSLYLLGEEAHALVNNITATHPSRLIFSVEKWRFDSADKKIILADWKQLKELTAHIDLLKNVCADQTTIYLFHSHATASSFFDAQNLIAALHFKMILDCWDALILVNNVDFKERQFFQLR